MHVYVECSMTSRGPRAGGAGEVSGGDGDVEWRASVVVGLVQQRVILFDDEFEPCVVVSLCCERVCFSEHYFFPRERKAARRCSESVLMFLDWFQVCVATI